MRAAAYAARHTAAQMVSVSAAAAAGRISVTDSRAPIGRDRVPRRTACGYRHHATASIGSVQSPGIQPITVVISETADAMRGSRQRNNMYGCDERDNEQEAGVSVWGSRPPGP